MARDVAQEEMQLHHTLEQSIAVDFKEGYMAAAFDSSEPMEYKELSDLLPSAYQASRAGRKAALEVALRQARDLNGCGE